MLWARFCAVIGIDPTLYEMPDQRVINPSLGVVQAEYLRRVNAAMGERVRPRDYSKIRKFVISDILEHTEPSPKPVLPERSFDTAAEVADRWIDTLRTGGFDVVGDLNDLRPVRAQSPGPDDWTEADVASVSVAAGAEVMIALARTKGALGEE